MAHTISQPHLENTQPALERMKASGVQVTSALDLGECIGEFTEIFSKVYPGVPVMMVEAQTRLALELMNVMEKVPCTIYEPHMLGREVKSAVPFYACEDLYGAGSSKYKENTNVPMHVDLLEQTTVDALMAAHPEFPQPNLVKMDLQGAELEALDGATKTLPGVEFIMIEVSAFPYNEGAPLVADVFAYMKAHGFRLYDFCGEQRIGHMLNQLDLTFVRETSKHCPRGKICWSNYPA